MNQAPQQHQQQQKLSPDQQAYLQERAKEQRILEEKLDNHVQSYPIQLLFPATVSPLLQDKDDDVKDKQKDGESKSPTLRTSSDFINNRLLDTSGLGFSSGEDENDNEQKQSTTTTDTESLSLSETFEALNDFVKDLQSTNCYDSVQVILGNTKNGSINGDAGDEKDNGPKKLNIVLGEKNWYNLYVGAGVKHDNIVSSTGATASFPKVQFESSASLINLSGLTDMTQCSYTIDQTSTPTLSLTHSRPLYSLFNPNSAIGDAILQMDQGSKFGITFRGNVDTLDYEHTRSSKDHIQSLGVRIANTTSNSATFNPASGEQIYMGLDWSLSHRDIVPRRHKSLPYLCDASPDIIACAGPSWKHSVTAEYKLNGNFTDDKYSPTVGLDSYGGVEIAGPPGDVGFAKFWAGGSMHLPIGGSIEGDENSNNLMPRGLSFHTVYNCGIMKSLSFGGLCSNGAGNMTNVSDRFYVGGSHQLRGFLPAGIGPRTDKGGASSPGGDSVGGDAYYTTTAMLSMPFLGDNFLSNLGVRLFGFINAGTLTGLGSAININSFVRSTRVAVGGGVSAATPMGRFEATYAVPLRYGPRDARRSVQGGIGFTFG